MKKLIFLTYLIFLSLAFAFGSSGSIHFTLNFFDKQIYYPDSSIKIKINVANESSESFSFNSAEIHSYNFMITVKSLRNIILPPSEKLIIDKNQDKPVFYRKITLMPGEEFSFITTLDKYTKINKPGIYIVQGEFYPDFNKTVEGSSIKSNILTLSVRPSTSVPALQGLIDTETHEILKKVAMPPDEIVSYLITSRQKGDWNKFFLYLDMESLIQNQPRMEAKFRNSSESERLEMIRKYKKAMENTTVDNDILLVPSSFEIQQTSYTSSRGKVRVLETFTYRTYKENKVYNYFLHKIDGIWSIYNYEVRNIGTE